ncbi:hypothetical protein TNIN_402991, partial [Trichonephila inaurata madagascariensis]
MKGLGIIYDTFDFGVEGLGEDMDVATT